VRERSAFYGDPNDLDQFLRLLVSPIRSERRELALREWETYKLSRQKAAVRESKLESPAVGLHKRGLWTKGDYIRSLTAAAIDLRGGATFTDVCLGYADLRGVQFDDVSFTHLRNGWNALKGAKLESASLRRAQLPELRLMEADLRGADLSEANLVGADLSGANLEGANLEGADLQFANLERARFVGVNIDGACLDGASVYGVSAWDLSGQPISSRNLLVTPQGDPEVSADDIQVAQFIYLLINNPLIRDVLDTVTRKVVHLLGRFTPERKHILDAMRVALRREGLVPVLFDFEKAEDRNITETVTLLARMARFVIADLSDPASIPQELQAIVPHVRVPIRMIIAEGQSPYSMSRDLLQYPWVIRPLYRYRDETYLMAGLRKEIIDVAEAKRTEIARDRIEETW